MFKQEDIECGDWVGTDVGYKGTQIGIARAFTNQQRVIGRSSMGDILSKDPEVHVWVDFATGHGNTCVPLSKITEVRKS